MSDLRDRIAQLSPKRLALLALELQEKLDAGGQVNVPIAVIGQACRFPGDADTPEAFWRLLADGRDAIREVPADRYDAAALYDPDPEAPGTIATRSGGFLSQIDGFDPNLFGISPREAQSMDPQQRLALEVAWEALENAGAAPDALGGSATGVFLGICNNDYYMHLAEMGPATIDAYRASGNAASVASGRISYVLGLQGPSVSVDTACSSSLLAVHLACQSLKLGESRAALAGGVNVICRPETTMALSRAHMLAPDGRCKAFDASADGFSRGEGCGMVVLKRLPDALAEGDRVLAVIRGSAANQDGRSSGLTAPNGPSQEAVIRAALRAAGLTPADLDYVEAHGTGTSLGDPIEVRALGAVFGPGRGASTPLRIGSVKTNLAHLESAAGIAGLIKLILSLQEEALPASLHFRTPNPHIEWASFPVTVVGRHTPWPRGVRQRIGGVSSFGFSGTNVHVVVEEAPASAEKPGASESPQVLTVSGRTAESLRVSAAAMAGYLAEHPTVGLADVAYTLAVGRAHLQERAAVTAATADAARIGLEAVARGEEAPNVARGQAKGSAAPRIAFLFTGQGSQFPGMGRDLYESEPVFRAALDRCDELTRGLLPRSLLSVLFPDSADDQTIHDTGWTQPALFALEWSLAELWRSWGIEPAGVAGHSIGEYVAAAVAGVMSPDDGLRLVTERGRLMQALPAGGAMAAIFADEGRVREALRPLADRVTVAAVNAPDSVVVSGDADAVQRLLADLERAGIRHKALSVSHAFHSPLVEPMLDAFERAVAGVRLGPARLDLASNVTGRLADPGELTRPGYWRAHAREAVRFADDVRALAAQGYRVFLEVGPAPTLVGLGRRCLPGADFAWIASLRPGREDALALRESLGQLYVRGARARWTELHREGPRRKLALPTYPFERERYWVEAPAVRSGPPAGAARPDGPLALTRLDVPVPTFEVVLSTTAHPFLGEHRVLGQAVAPGAWLALLARTAGNALSGEDAWDVEAFTIRRPLVLPQEDARRVQVVATPAADGNSMGVEVFAKEAGNGATRFVCHAAAMLRRATGEPYQVPPLAALRARCGELHAPAEFYAKLEGYGIVLGSRLRVLEEIRCGGGSALARVRQPAADGTVGGDAGIHPAVLDSAFQTLGAALAMEAEEGPLRLLGGFDRLRIHRPVPEFCHVFAELRPASEAGGRRTGDVWILDEAGQVCAEALGLALTPASLEAMVPAAATDRERWFHELQWRPKPLSDPAAAQSAAADFPATASLGEAGRSTLRRLAEAEGLERYRDALPALDDAARAFVTEALERLGWRTLGGPVTATEAAERLRVVPGHRRLFAHLLDDLAAHGWLGRAGSRFTSLRTADSAMERLASVCGRFPECGGESRIVERCGPFLAGVLRGETDPLGLLFPAGSLGEVERLYQDTPFARAYNGALRDAVAAAVAGLPPGTRVRVVEVGAGTGGTTAFVLPALPTGHTDYLFTDTSHAFLARAEEKFAKLSGVSYRVLDIEQDPATQGFRPGEADVVVAANVLHATRDLGETLAHVRALLASGGLLVLLEGTGVHAWVDITFGLTEGWWRFRDPALRPSYPLMDAETWSRALGDAGFETQQAIGGDRDSPLGEQTILLARKPLAAAEPFCVLVGDGRGMGDRLAEAVREAGGTATRVGAASGLPERLPELRRAAAGRPVRVVYLGGLEAECREEDDAQTVVETAGRRCAELVELVQTLRDVADVRLWVLTRGAQAAGGAVTAPEQAPLWGLARVVALEEPGLLAGIVDLDPESAENSRQLAAEVCGGNGEDQVAFRKGERLVARLALAAAPRAAWKPRGDARYLITGGTGGLGFALARELVERGARHLVLTSRRGTEAADPAERRRRQEAVAALEALGACVDARACDVADESALAAILSESPPVRGVFHLAVEMSEAPLATLDANALVAMLRPKVAGAWALHRVTRELDLDVFVLFSSSTSLLGVGGLGHYAAANQFLDALAHWRRGRGLPALAVNWGIWEVMRAASASDRRRFAQAGLRPMATTTATDALAALLGSGATQAMVAAIDWPTLRAGYEARRQRPLLELLGAPAASKAGTAPEAGRPTGGSDLLARVAAAPAGRRRELLLGGVRAEAGRILGLDPARLDPERGLFELGMDSLMSVELKGRLERLVERTLPGTLTFNYPNVAALASYLEEQLFPAAADGGAKPLSESAPAPAQANTAEAANHDDLSEEDLAALLRKRLQQI